MLINKSTVPVGTARKLQAILQDHGVPNFGIASNPEFLPEGDAVEKSRKPDRVVVGADTPEDFTILRRVYSQFVDHVRIRYIETTPETAEAIKYVGNTLLLTYISFWNGVGARLGETFPNVRMEDLKRGVTSDARISTWGSYVSNGAGGSCFGKDIQSLIYQFKTAGQPANLLQSVYDINEYQKTYMIDRAAAKPERPSTRRRSRCWACRSSSAPTTCVTPRRSRWSSRCWDAASARFALTIRWRRTRRNTTSTRQTITCSRRSATSTARKTLAGSDMLFISTDWEEFRGLSRTIEELVKPPYLIIDGRRMIPDYQELVAHGYSYIAVGSRYMPGAEVSQAGTRGNRRRVSSSPQSSNCHRRGRPDRPPLRVSGCGIAVGINVLRGKR